MSWPPVPAHFDYDDRDDDHLDDTPPDDLDEVVYVSRDTGRPITRKNRPPEDEHATGGEQCHPHDPGAANRKETNLP